MRTLVWLVRGFIFLFLFAFAIKNNEPVNLQFFLDTAWQAPLVIVILAFFAAGAFFGALSLLGTIFGLRRELASVRKQLKQATRAAAEASLPSRPAE